MAQMKDCAVAAPIPPPVRGSSTSRKVRIGAAPRSALASRSLRSIPSRTDRRMKKQKGKVM